jgi:hypothetical protein
LIAAAASAGITVQLDRKCLESALRSFRSRGFEGRLFLNLLPQTLLDWPELAQWLSGQFVTHQIDHREAGGLAGIDRDGTRRHFPLLSASIAAFEVDGSHSITPDVIAETLRQTKALAKAKPGCTCLLAAGDRIIDLVSRSESPDRSALKPAPRVAARA